jgi:chromosome segregation ATPase
MKRAIYILAKALEEGAASSKRVIRTLHGALEEAHEKIRGIEEELDSLRAEGTPGQKDEEAPQGLGRHDGCVSNADHWEAIVGVQRERDEARKKLSEDSLRHARELAECKASLAKALDSASALRSAMLDEANGAPGSYAENLNARVESLQAQYSNSRKAWPLREKVEELTNLLVNARHTIDVSASDRESLWADFKRVAQQRDEALSKLRAYEQPVKDALSEPVKKPVDVFSAILKPSQSLPCPVPPEIARQLDNAEAQDAGARGIP